MPRLYFKYGTMGSSKSAQALMAKFNYEQKGMRVLLLKPSLDNSDEQDGQTPYVRSRIGLKSRCYTFKNSDSLANIYYERKFIEGKYDCVIVEEEQF